MLQSARRSPQYKLRSPIRSAQSSKTGFRDRLRTLQNISGLTGPFRLFISKMPSFESRAHSAFIRSFYKSFDIPRCLPESIYLQKVRAPGPFKSPEIFSGTPESRQNYQVFLWFPDPFKIFASEPEQFPRVGATVVLYSELEYRRRSRKKRGPSSEGDLFIS